MDADLRYMDRALELARTGWGRVHPNPLVGAVIVRDGRVVGEGSHTEFGGAHAEVVAIDDAGDEARGATLYVTLEPCAHHGKTPPCTRSILDAGIARVVFGAADPDPAAAGGAAVLEGAGVTVRGGVREDVARSLNAAFHHIHERKAPYVSLKLAISMDAKLSRQPGRPTTVTGPESHAEVHRLRAGFDALLVGRGTVAADDPELTVRGALVPRVPPVRVVLDSRAATPTDCRMLRGIDVAPVWVFSRADADPDAVAALEAAGARTFRSPPGDAGIDVSAVLDMLWREGIRSVLCEGGGRVAAGLLAADAVCRIHLFVAPVLFGTGGTPAFPLERVPATDWRLTEVRRLGSDTHMIVDRVREA